ncbi:MAG: hypothetical protein H7301_06375 [Cryobacterium sp.]|nr:hypothetical protein [Oligoflexia bacterium]
MSAAKTNAKKILERVRNARSQLESFLKDRSWIEEAKKIAEKQGNEVKKLIDTDVAKLRVFLEKEKKELEKLQAQIPGEVTKIKKFVEAQKKELSGLLTSAKSGKGKKTKKVAKPKQPNSKKAGSAKADTSKKPAVRSPAPKIKKSPGNKA